jgi:hypothetical protein
MDECSLVSRGRMVLWILLAGTPVVGAHNVVSQAPSLAVTRELFLSGAELDLVPISSIVVDSRGRMYVWQDDDARIRRFEPDGTEIEPIARAGEGPGEFRMRSLGGTVGDTFWVSDPMLRRTTFFKPDGKLLRTRRWPPGVTLGEEYYPAGFGVQPLVVEPGGTQVVTIYRLDGLEVPTWWRPADAGSIQLRVDTTGRFVKVLSSLPARTNPCSQAFVVPGLAPGGTIGIPFCQNSHWRQAFELDRFVRVSPDSTRPGGFVISATHLDGTPIFSTRFEQPRVRIPREVADSARRALQRPMPGPFPTSIRR